MDAFLGRLSCLPFILREEPGWSEFEGMIFPESV